MDRPHARIIRAGKLSAQIGDRRGGAGICWPAPGFRRSSRWGLAAAGLRGGGHTLIVLKVIRRGWSGRFGGDPSPSDN
jgi:hypothetical protein